MPNKGLEEHQVWAELEVKFEHVKRLPRLAARIANFSFSEVLNNAIDHSGAREVLVRVSTSGSTFWFEIEDRGAGLFEHVRDGLSLATELEGFQELTKGKVTTDPSRHTGEGLFWVSKATDLFEAHSGTLRWVADNVRGDVAVMDAPRREGTLVRGEIGLDTERVLSKLFEDYSTEHKLTRSRIHIKLFEKGFRVWARAHPETRLLPEGMERAVEFMVKRAQAAS
jgi:hypothetical protein